MKLLIHNAKLIWNRMAESRWSLFGPLALLGLSATGCTALVSPIQTIPAVRVPPELLAIPVANDRIIDYPRLRQTEPEDYILDKDDVLGIHIENLFAGEDPNSPQIPPVTMPEPGTDLSPGIGLPYPIRDDGTISMPFVGPIAVKGLTLAQAEEVVGRVYVEKNFLQEGQRPIVSLLRKRTTWRFIRTRSASPSSGVVTDLRSAGAGASSAAVAVTGKARVRAVQTQARACCSHFRKEESGRGGRRAVAMRLGFPGGEAGASEGHAVVCQNLALNSP
ncbi:MAG: polysaccharide biosynthesis/export family protein, partial [Planctomycetaceae bacterium]|nr:polysaccharide biosynthesis/export family protein [Planctomycetaceae bacterium]